MIIDKIEPSSGRTLTAADEKRIARELSPAVAWPTLALAVLLPLAHWSIVGLGLARVLPLWPCAALLTLTSYAHYTLAHEAIHGNLVPGRPAMRWLNPVVGWAAALAMGYNWPALLRTHVLHHAHTNTPDDPDYRWKGSLAKLVVTWAVETLIFMTLPPILFRRLSPAIYREMTWGMVGSEPAQADAVAIAVLALLALAIATGHTMDWLCLLYIPTRLGALLLDIFFSWLPHHPFDRAERYLNTRISLWPGGGVLLLSQNLHLMHHLWPGVPFYNYGRLFRRLRPVLVAKGSRIEGLMVGPYARDRSGV